jgi:lipoprotein-releasing system ATP-binding protein
VIGEFMATARETGMTALIATHNEGLAAKLDRVVHLHDGVLTEVPV